MSMHRIVAALSLLFAFSIALGACGGGGPSGPPGGENTLQFGNGAEPEGLDPHFVTGIPEHHILLALFEGLTNLDPQTLEPVPGVAESWDLSDDGLTYTFHLRENAQWSNGDPIVAGDFLYAWKRILMPSLASKYAYMLHDMKNARAYNEGAITDFNEVGAKVLDDRTLQVTLEHPTPYFLQLHIHYTWFPLHQATVEKYGAIDDRASKWTRPGNMVSNGPFTLEAWEPNNVIATVKNPRYWDANTVSLDGINFYPTTNLQTEERQFRAGDLHITENVPNAKMDTYRRDNPGVLRTDPWLGSYFYRINVERPPLDDVRVRRAITMAIDRQAIVERVMKGGQQAAYYMTPPGMNGYTPRKHFEEDLAEARRLLAEAGYPNGKDFPYMEIHYNTQDNHKQIAEVIQQMWKKNLNIEVGIINEDWKVYLDTQSRQDYYVSRAGWIADFLDPLNFLECFTTDNGNNRTGYANPEYDALVLKARRTSDIGARNAIYDEIESILMRDLPLLPIYIYTRVYLLSPEVEGKYANLLDYPSYKHIRLRGQGRTAPSETD